MQDFVAAVDGGGTKTAIATADRDGTVTVLPQVAGCNPQDNPLWAENLTRALRQITASGQPEFAVLGLPGHGEVPDHDAAMERLVEGQLNHALVINDVALAWHGAFTEGHGVLLLAGTGSMAMASGPEGLHRVGGWGDLIGDEGSAFWIGQAALRLASQAWDGRRGTADLAFAESLLGRMGLSATAPFPFLDWLMGQAHPRTAMAELARDVDALAGAGDPSALALLQRAADELALLARTAARRAGLDPGFPWCPAGSVFRSTTLSGAVARALGRPPQAIRFDALGGGLWLAAQRAGWPPDMHWQDRVRHGLGLDLPTG
jgi:glucosamine kinase